MGITGLHHITIVANDAQRNIDFYTGVLGMRLVKKTVNFDAPESYHLYFGDETGRPGTAITFFEWPGAPKGAPGIGGTHHFALRTPTYEALLKWKRRLTDLGLTVDGPFDRRYFTSIAFRDPDGTIVEIATDGPGWTVDEPEGQFGAEYREPPSELLIAIRDEAHIRAEMWPEPIPQITADMALMQGMHHISAIGADIERTHAFFGGLLGLQRVKMTSDVDTPGSAHWYWGVGEGAPGTLITYVERDPRREPRVRMGAGQTHHYAFAVATEEAQLAFREKLLGAGLRVSPVMDRIYFKSIYTNDPDGHIVEIATAGPGFAVDEPVAELGTHLKLPPWYEAHRDSIERNLKPISAPIWSPAR
ncbi:MAG: VOC family protein [Anaerolineales bacterium]|nr:VOC family protein [Anaerolineales bacterium]